MKFRYLAAAASALLLVLAGASTATAAIDNNFACLLDDVKIENGNALACAGSFTGNDVTTVEEDGALRVRDGNTVMALTEEDWSPVGAAPDPIDGWLFGGKLDLESKGDQYEAGVLGEGSITVGESGTFSVNIGAYAEAVLAFKQQNKVAFYYFKNGGDGVYDLSWAGGDDFDLSHLSVYVRGVPEPATVALLGLGLLGLAFARRRLSS